MNTLQLRCVLSMNRRTKNLQVIAANQLPYQVTHFPFGYIVNTEESHLPGEHWIAFWFESPQYGEFFDSFGNSPDVYKKQFRNTLRQSVKQFRYNDQVLQSSDSNTCGMFVLLYLILKAKGYSLKRIQRLFTKDTRWNDQLIYDFALRYFKHCI